MEQRPDPKMPTVAIVGIGPRGLYCLEALIAEFNAHPLGTGLHVAIFNKSNHFGASPIYDPDQPPYLLSNVRAKELDLWSWDESDTTKPAGPGFIQWHQVEFQPSAPLDPETYPSRAMVGQYLVQGFQRLMSQVPPGVRISKFTAEVTDIVRAKGGYRLKFVDATGREDELLSQKVMLTTGHSFVRPSRIERHYRSFAARHTKTSFIPYAYPVVENMGRIPVGARVAMRGIGLTFIDAVLGLTEGRGGVFKRAADGQLCYLMSGQEPREIYPYCRTGLPILPKPVDFPSATRPARPLTFITPARLTELRRRTPGGRLDLERDIWSLVELEMELQYYKTAIDDPSARRELEECGDDVRATRRAIRGLLASHPRLAPFNYWTILDPIGEQSFSTGAEFHSFVGHYLHQEISYARAGLYSSPARAAVSMWSEIRAALKPFVAFGGLTPDSHRLLIEYYFPLFKRVVLGPPLINIEKVLALHRAGVLDFSVARSPRVITRNSAGCFELNLSSLPGTSARAEILVDARYPTVEICRDITPLYQSLCRRRMIREFKNMPADLVGTTYPTGAIDMSQGSQYVINQRGTANTDIAVHGTPTEGNVIGTFNITRDGYAPSWAANIIKQLRIGAEQR